MAASVKALSESPSLARLMAAEPAAPQAGSPIAFFTGRHSDSVDAFVTDVINNTGTASGDNTPLHKDTISARVIMSYFLGHAMMTHTLLC